MTQPARRYSALSLAALSLALAGCGSSATSTSSSITTARPAAAVAPAGRKRPAGARPAAPPGGSGATSATDVDTGAYTLAGASATVSGRALSARRADESGVLVTSAGVLDLRDARVSTSGGSRSSDQSSFYGLDAGILVEAGGRATIAGGSVSTTGDGANGVFAYGSGARITIARASIRAGGQYAHGAMASGGGSVTLHDVDVATAGQSSAAVATDRGGGTIEVSGGTMITSGFRSPGIYSTGQIAVRAARMTATGAEAAVVEGANAITVTDTTLSAAKEHGVMLYNSMSGDASPGTGRYTMIGGTLTAAQGPAFYVTNTRAVITLSGGARVRAASGVLLRADSAGTGSGNTGAGIATLSAAGVTLAGDLETDGTGTIAAKLTDHTTLRGTVSGASLTIEGSSVWTVTGDSTLRALADPAGISGASITNIVGDGHTVTYDAALSPGLEDGVYRLRDGGTLRPG